MIRHTVAFRLRHAPNSTEEADFLTEIRTLEQIPGVDKFECCQQVGKKCNFTFGLSMEFNDQETYDAYSNHPDHCHFVNERWIPEVSDFIELDYVII